MKKFIKKTLKKYKSKTSKIIFEKTYLFEYLYEIDSKFN